MKQNEIEVGVTYHNGKTGNRSYSAREVLQTGAPYTDWIYGKMRDGIKYKQIEGPNKGWIFTLRARSFAQWAKGRVGEETDHA